MTVIRKPYDERERVAIECKGGLTEQNHRDACDVHHIVRRYDQTGLIQHVNTAVAQYGDFTEVNEYQESLNTVIRAQDAFDQLPAKIRAKFNNDPGEFFEFATNPDNLQEMIDLGLAEKMAEPQPMKVEVINKDEPAAEAE